MKSRLFTLLGVLFVFPAFSQTPPSFSSSDIFLQLQKLRVLGSVLYVAAHPDDENTRLLAWLAKDRMYRTGYLSITRGDGGQNLIGDEQGVDLGLIRTQELLAARRIDGAEQFFTRGFDFGYTKTTQEALATWNQEKVLADVVWVIRKFRPDVLIARFPEDNRAGHGHHSASAVLAHEAFRAAADSTRFSEQLTQGVSTWQCKRILWNTFNFGGGSNTTSEDQLKVDVGSYNNLLGKSFGEIAAASRSQHKSQGFGVPASRGSQWEYFSAIEGSLARKDLMEGVETSWQRIPGTVAIAKLIDSLITGFVISRPEASVPMLVRLYQNLQQLPEAFWKEQKVKEVKELIEACGGLWMEAVCNAEYAVQGDTLSLQVTVNDRAGITSRLVKVGLQNDPDAKAGQVLEKNKNLSFVLNKYIDPRLFPLTQPYWLVEKMAPGSYNVPAQTMRGLAQDPPPLQADFQLEIAGVNFTFSKPVRYKYTDPVKGELYQPLVIAPPVVVSTEPAILLFRKGLQQTLPVKVKLTTYHNFSGLPLQLTLRSGTTSQVRLDSSFSLAKGLSKEYAFTVRPGDSKGLAEDQVRAYASLPGRSDTVSAYLNVTGIQYDHIPPIHYYYEDVVKVLNIDLKTAGKRIGYIEGAGDRVPQALAQMGYEVTLLKEKDLELDNLTGFDAILTGVRAYNIHAFLADKYAVLMNYVKGGGNLIVQYNTNSFIGTVKSALGPYPFLISRNRVTDETAEVNFILPDHPVLNYPNKITKADFTGWIQERGIYFAEGMEANYQMPLTMKDAGEPDQKGSLIITDYGKGKFVYTGLVFFRELPAGVAGAYRLLANLIALNQPH